MTDPTTQPVDPEDLIRRYPGSGLELTADTSRQVAVLRYAPPGEG